MGAGASQDSGNKAQSTQRSSDSQPQEKTAASGGGAAASPSNQQPQQQQQQPQQTTAPAAAAASSAPPPQQQQQQMSRRDDDAVQPGAVSRDNGVQPTTVAKVQAVNAFNSAVQRPNQQPPPSGKTQDELDEEEWQREKEKLSQRLREKREKEAQQQQQQPPPPGDHRNLNSPDKPPPGPGHPPSGGLSSPTSNGAVAPPATDQPKKKRLLNGTDIEHRYPSGSVYHGGFKDGKLHGYGTYKYHPSGDVYEGEWVADMKHGHGMYRYDCGDQYTGEWRTGKKHGKGTYRFTSGDEYVGNWKEDKIHGHGVFHIARNGNRYEGNWVESYRHGYGVLYCGNGDVYYGNWTKGKEDGAGVLVYSNGNIYAGDWKAGQMDGKGIMVESAQKFTVEHIAGYLIAKVPVELDGAVDPDWNPANKLYMAHLAKMEAEARGSGGVGGGGGGGADSEALAAITAERDMWMRRYQDLLSSKGAGSADGDGDLDGLNLNDHAAVRARLAELKEQRDLQQRRADENEQRIRAAEAHAKELDFEVKRLKDDAIALKATQGTGGGGGSTAELDKMQRRVADLERELNARKQASTATGSKDSNDPVQLKAQIELLEGEVRHLRSTREELQKIREQHLDAQRTIMSLEQKNEELLKEINIQRQRASHASNEASEEVTRNMQLLQDELKDVRAELQDAKVAVLTNEQNLKKAKQKLKEAEEKALRVPELEAQVVQLRNAKSSTAALQDKRSEELDSLRQKNAELMRQLEELQAEGPIQGSASQNNGGGGGASAAQLAELQAKNEALAADMKKDKKKAKKVAAERDELAAKAAALQVDVERASRVVAATLGRAVNIVRVRPQLPTDAGRKPIEASGNTVTVNGQQTFTGFDTCVGADVAANDAVIDELRSTARAAALGYNACVLMLGPMHTGKSTLCAAAANVLLQEVFRAVDELTKGRGSASSYTPSYHATCIEVACDGIFDLNHGGSTGFDLRPMKDSFGAVVLDGAVAVPLQLARDAVVDFIGASGRRQRKRSHVIYNLHVTLRHKITDACIRGKFTLADLAGAGSLGEQDDVEAAKYINKSIMALGNVITALSEGQTGVPYRDDPLTQVLADALGGNCRLATVTVVPPVVDEAETIAQALSVAVRLTKVDCRPKMQIETAEMSRLRHLVEQLQSPDAAKPHLVDIDSVRD